MRRFIGEKQDFVIQNLNRSYCRCLMVGVMWCSGFVWLRILAAEYCIYWSLSRVLLGTMNRTPLQYLRQEVLNACMRVSATELAREGQSLEVFLM